MLGLPQYGERWGRHWLDVVRFAQTNGYERDDEKPLVWKFRDYVIRSFNEDKPYDRFVMEQIAGDELPNVDNDSLIATAMAWAESLSAAVSAQGEQAPMARAFTGAAWRVAADDLPIAGFAPPTRANIPT